jgi:hypothetical protein
VWNRDGSNRARILVNIRLPDLLEVPISLVLCHNDSDEGHGHSWTVVNYILQAKLIGGLGEMKILCLLMEETHTHCQMFLLEEYGMTWLMATILWVKMLHQIWEMLHMVEMLHLLLMENQ